MGRLVCVEGLGYKRFQLLYSYFGSVDGIWNASVDEWMLLGVPKRVVDSFRRLKSGDFRFDGFSVVFYDDDRYPVELRDIDSPPLGLFYEGDLGLLRSGRRVAVVGTRRMSEYGERVTKEFVKGLVDKGFVIVSGLAKGIDSVAHDECLGSGGRTIAVLAHGLDMTYPRSNKKLRDRIVESGGLILSEYAPWVRPRPEYFVARNRIVSGLSESVLVMEAYSKSGTKTTVGFALKQGRDVFVVPGSLDMPSYRGCIEIIQDGGYPVLSIDDVVS